jgi:hypothetical protein
MEDKNFNEGNYLYHYTIKKALKILGSKSLHFGKLKKMNDVNE